MVSEPPGRNASEPIWPRKEKPEGRALTFGAKAAWSVAGTDAAKHFGGVGRPTEYRASPRPDPHGDWNFESYQFRRIGVAIGVFPGPILGMPLNPRSMSALVCSQQSSSTCLDCWILADLSLLHQTVFIIHNVRFADYLDLPFGQAVAFLRGLTRGFPVLPTLPRISNPNPQAASDSSFLEGDQ
jgi:hypothetical protein